MLTAAAILYAAAMLVLLVFGLNQLWLAVRHARADRLRGGPAPGPGAELPPEPPVWPRVTVQLPLYNERYVAARLLDAVARLEYPRDRLDVQVLDDSTDETAAVVAERVAYWRRRGLDVVHVRRVWRDGFKAGALANGLTFARGDLVAVFDADFVPPPDFLRRTAPLFADARLGLVQARWDHLNAQDSALTAVQAALLDAHFAIEQAGRQEAGCFVGFNGTAGVWRRATIDDAGGWHADTLTEDLDLSYRAQLAGWRFRFLPDLAVPAELPLSVAAWRGQQFRWTKGAAETTRKVLGRVLRAPLAWRVRVQGALHLTNFAVFPAILVAALLHAPLLAAYELGFGPPPLYLALLGLGLFAFAGVGLAHLLTQRALYPDWPRRMLGFPSWIAASTGLAFSNTRGALEAFVRRRSAFERTPKVQAASAAVRWRGAYAAAARGWAEGLLALYAMAGLLGLLACGAWAAAPFQVLFVTGFGFVAAHDPVQRWRALRRPLRDRTLAPA